MTEQSQFALLGKKRFLPFFITQLLGAFNDNIFKQSLILAILFKISSGTDKALLINLCALLFILPFFLFSALAIAIGAETTPLVATACLVVAGLWAWPTVSAINSTG